jgi:hypothetical protein
LRRCERKRLLRWLETGRWLLLSNWMSLRGLKLLWLLLLRLLPE